MEKQFEDMFRFVRQALLSESTGSCYCGRFPFRDRYQHTRRVFGWAQRLMRVEPADPFITLTAAVFHDAGYRILPTEDHALASAELCQGYMKQRGYPSRTIQQVVYLVAMHSEKTRPLAELSGEMRVLIDADLLDEVGALTALWDSMAEGAQPRQSYLKTYRRLQLAHEKLAGKRGRMRTGEGLRLYDGNLAALDGFLTRLRYELCLEEDIFDGEEEEP